jgi:hypothetical protein
MLELRPNCGCCDCDLPPDVQNALICSYECTFCVDCATNVLSGTCPNCNGPLAVRPIRSADRLAMHPASEMRVLSDDPRCAALRAQRPSARKTDRGIVSA